MRQAYLGEVASRRPSVGADANRAVEGPRRDSAAPRAPSATSPVATWDVPPNMTLEEIEKFVIERTLQRTGGNKQKAANMLGIYRPRLYSKIKKYKIGLEAVSQN